MRFLRLIGSVFQHTKPRRKTPDYELLVINYDLSLVEENAEIPRLIPLRDDMYRAWRERDFRGYQIAFEQARRSGGIVESARPLYSLVSQWFFEEFSAIGSEKGGRRHEALLPAFENFARNHPSAFSAATYADALRSTAFAWRGTAYAAETPEARWRKYHTFLAASHSILDAYADAGASDFSWLMSDARRAADGSTFARFKSSFEAAWALDRYNIDLCRAHARMLMPRWLGRDARDLEAFAREAIGHTKDRYGYGLYALIQQANTEVGDHEFEQTLCDPELVKLGFEDLLKRFPAPSIMNLYADMLEWMRDEDALAELLRTRFRVLVPWRRRGCADRQTRSRLRRGPISA